MAGRKERNQVRFALMDRETAYLDFEGKVKTAVERPGKTRENLDWVAGGHSDVRFPANRGCRSLGNNNTDSPALVAQLSRASLWPPASVRAQYLPAQQITDVRRQFRPVDEDSNEKGRRYSGFRTSTKSTAVCTSVRRRKCCEKKIEWFWLLTQMEMATDKEASVQLEAGEFLVKMLPASGGKIASVQSRGRELMQLPLGVGYRRSRTMSFEGSDASGWDECLPSVAACHVATDGRTIEVPDHGDLWRVPWMLCAANANTCTMKGKCFSLPLELLRTASLRQIKNGARLSLHYTLRSFGKHAVPWTWTAHPLWAVEPGDRILLPKTIQTMRLEISRNQRLGKPGSVVKWPIALVDGGQAELSVVQPASTEIGDKLFAGPLQEGDNWCALERNSLGLRIQVRYDPAATPFLGLWLCYGGWPLRDGPKQMCVGLEPSTAPVDSLEHAASWERLLKPGEISSWKLTVDFSQIL